MTSPATSMTKLLSAKMGLKKNEEKIVSEEESVEDVSSDSIEEDSKDE